MVSNSIIIQRDTKTVWKRIEEEFYKTFTCSGKEILGKRIETKARSYTGNLIKVIQEVTEYSPEQSIAVQSINRDDVVTNRYRISPVDPCSCQVELSVDGRNRSSVFKTWNYWLMSLPVFRSGTKKRLGIQLARLKDLIEQEGDRTDDPHSIPAEAGIYN